MGSLRSGPSEKRPQTSLSGRGIFYRSAIGQGNWRGALGNFKNHQLNFSGLRHQNSMKMKYA